VKTWNFSFGEAVPRCNGELERSIDSRHHHLLLLPP